MRGVPNGSIVARLRDKVAVSTGSACSSGIEGPSHVLCALGLPADVVDGALRIGLGKFTTDEEVDRAAELIAEASESACEVLTTPVRNRPRPAKPLAR